MQQLTDLPLGRKLIAVAGVLLIIDSFLDWQQVSISIAGVSASGGQSAWHGFWGILLVLMTIVLVAWVLARAFGVEIPATVPEAPIVLALGVLIPVFALLKVITDNYVHWPAYVGIILGAAIAYGSWLVFQEHGATLPHVAQT